MALTAEEIARRSADAMWARDDASKWLGASLDAVGPGTATMSMTVEKHHTNGHDICHGGFIFTLADSAFAFACNSYNQLVVAQHNVITFVAPLASICVRAKCSVRPVSKTSSTISTPRPFTGRERSARTATRPELSCASP